MTPEEMTDEQLLEDREVSICMPIIDLKGYKVTLSCGHEVIFVIEPHRGMTLKCAQCVNLLVDCRKEKC